MKHIYNILIGFALLSLLACEGKTFVKKEIVNNSSYTITFEITATNDEITEIEVAAKSTQVLSSTTEIGAKKDLEGGCTVSFKQIRSFVPLGRSLTIDPAQEEFWKKTTERTKKTPKHFTHICTLVIEEKHVQ
jgi:hypothetical protein